MSRKKPQNWTTVDGKDQQFLDEAALRKDQEDRDAWYSDARRHGDEAETSLATWVTGDVDCQTRMISLKRDVMTGITVDVELWSSDRTRLYGLL